MSLQNPIQPVNPSQPINNALASANPQLYYASRAGQNTVEEQGIMDNIQRLLAKDKELNQMHDAGKAYKIYNDLDPVIKQGLQFINEGAQYQKAPPSLLGKALKGGLNAVANPFREILHTAMVPIKSVHTAYDVTRQATNNSEAFKYLLTKKSWSDAWNGHNQWNQDELAKLEEQHGRAASFLARGIIDGKKPGDIIREYGQLDTDMVNAIRMMSDVDAKGNNSVDWTKVMTDHKSNQINYGNDITKWFNSNHPPKDGGVWSYVAPYALQPLGIIGIDNNIHPSKDGEQWLIDNPNPFSKGGEVSPSGFNNFVFDIVMDPMTWLTMGSTKSMMQSEKLAETFIQAGRNNSATRVADLFADPAVAQYHTGLADAINGLRAARKAGDDAASAYARINISQNFSKYDNDIILNRLTTAKVLNDEEKLVPVTDLKTMQKFFEMGEHTNYIISGRTEGSQYYTENHVAIERSTRKLTNGVRALWDEMVNGVDRKVLNGIEVIPDKVRNSATEFDKYMANAREFKLIDPKSDEALNSLTRHGNQLQRAYNAAMSKHPANVMIYTEDNMVVKSVGPFRDFARVIVGDKVQANLLAERYLRVSPEERINLLYSMFKLYTDKIGLASTVKGLEKQRGFLESIFAPVKGAGPITNPVMPEHLIKDNMLEIPTGISQLLHTTEGISMPNFQSLIEDVHNTRNFSSAIAKNFGFSGLTNEAWAKFVMGSWSKLTLFPKLGTKSAVDEGTIGLMVQHPRAILDFFWGKGSAVSNTVAAYRGSSETYGLVKNKLLSGLGRNPAEYVSAAERKAMQAPVKVDVSYRLPNGKLINRNMIVSADEYFGAPYEERLANKVIAKYAGKLTSEEQRYLATHLLNNSHALEGMVQSHVARSFGSTMVDGTMAAEIYGKSALTEAVDEWGRKDMGKFITDEHNMLLNSERTQIHYDAFNRYFGYNALKMPNGKMLDLGNTFIKHNALRSAEDGQAYVDDVMQQIGWVRNKDGNWAASGKIVAEDEYGKVISTASQSLKTIKYFNGRFGQTYGLTAAGKSASQISEGIIYKSMGELYNIFHGSGEKGVFNEGLLNALQSKVAEAEGKITARKSFEASDAAMRRYAKKPLVVTDQTKESRAAYEARQTNYAYHARNMPFADFEVLAKDFPIIGELKTQYDMPSLVDSAESAFKKYGEIPWKMMDKQLTDLYRADAFGIKVLQQRKILAADEKQMVNDLVKSGVNREDALLQADIFMDTRATHNAADELMKYADNPDVRSQMAWNLRGVGRFYRATEDYVRRAGRYLVAHPDKIIYRAGHAQQAINGSGVMYTDDKGNQYVMVPNDAMLWNMVAPVLTAVADPVRATENVVRGNWDFFKQPKWNQYSAKVSLLNPSYNDAAGIPSLTGPTIAIPVKVVQSLLGMIGRTLNNEQTLVVADNLDNIILGPGSDNTSWMRAALPSGLVGLWSQFEPEHKTGIQATTLMQAAANLEYSNSTKMKPEDWGNAEKVQQHYDRLRIATLNLLSVKVGFNLESPVTLSTNDANFPNDLRRTGVIGFRQEFSDILRAVIDVNSKYGYYIGDPVATAVSMFTASDPDKLVWTVGTGNKAAKAAISYTKETKLWTMKNTNLLHDYSDVAWVFAPNIGKYDPSVVTYLAAMDIIPGQQNPFDSNDAILKRYLLSAATARARNDYYNVDRELEQQLNDPNNPDRNRATVRGELIRRANDIKTAMKANNPALALDLGTNPVVARQELIQKFNHLDQMVNNPKYFDVLPKGDRNQMALMTARVNRMLAVFEDVNIRSQFNGQDSVDKVYQDGVDFLTQLSAGNPSLTEAWTSVIKPLINDVYKIPTKAMGKP
jgi:hypothetical protein